MKSKSINHQPTGNYGKNWDQYYRRTYRLQKKEALWDVSPEMAVAKDFQLFAPYFERSLPIIDLGCGIGTQTVFLAQHFARVLGVDVSEEAIAIAQSILCAENVRFEKLDITNVKQAEMVHQVLGDAHIYIRGVLHQILAQDQSALMRSLRLLMGTTGRLFFNEVSDTIRDYFENASDSFSQLPESIRNTFISNLPPRGMNVYKIRQLFSEDYFCILSLGESQLYTNIEFKNQSPIFIPSVYGIISNV